jgi:hypothetical protein
MTLARRKGGKFILVPNSMFIIGSILNRGEIKVLGLLRTSALPDAPF